MTLDPIPDVRPVLIAELCQNHGGDRALLRDMVQAAGESGADYVKIQGLYSADLTRRKRFDTGSVDAAGAPTCIKRPYRAEVKRLCALDLDHEAEEAFVQECRDAGVGSMVTVFTRASVERLAGLGFEAVKVASYDSYSPPLLRDLARHWGRIVVSTGAAFPDEVERAAAELQGIDLSLLHCVSIYPTPLELLNLRRMEWLRQLCPSVGLSDHTAPSTTGLLASRTALALGADVIERHFTVLGPDATRDGPVSINPAQLATLRAFADLPIDERRAQLDADSPGWSDLGPLKLVPSDQELLNRDYYQGRVASHVGQRPVYNWEDVSLDNLARFPAVRSVDAGV